MFHTTKHWTKYWENRNINWEEAYYTPDHSHRNLIIEALSKMRFQSLLEVGCASGGNLARIKHAFPRAELGGIDVSKEAIMTAKKYIPNTIFDVKPAHDIFMSTDSCDVVLADMTLIYIGNIPKLGINWIWKIPYPVFRDSSIKKALKEMQRVCRKHIVLVEFHSTSWLKRLALRFATGYNSYDYVKLLESMGWYDVRVRKLTAEDWPGGEPQKSYGYLITADR